MVWGIPSSVWGKWESHRRMSGRKMNTFLSILTTGIIKGMVLAMVSRHYIFSRPVRQITHVKHLEWHGKLCLRENQRHSLVWWVESFQLSVCCTGFAWQRVRPQAKREFCRQLEIGIKLWAAPPSGCMAGDRNRLWVVELWSWTPRSCLLLCFRVVLLVFCIMGLDRSG